MPRKLHRAPYLQRRRWSIREARAALADLHLSGLSMSEFARREGLEAQRLYRWQRRLGGAVDGGSRPAPSTPPLIEIRARRPETIEVVLGSGRVLRVSETIDTTVLARLVGVLDRTSGC